MLLRKSYRGLPPEGSTARANSCHRGAPGSPAHSASTGAGDHGRVEGKGPSQLESSPEATGKQDVGSFRLHRLRVGRGEVLRHGEGMWTWPVEEL